MRQSLDERELTALEQERDVASLLLTFRSPARVRAVAGAVSTAHALARSAGVFRWFELMKSGH